MYLLLLELAQTKHNISLMKGILQRVILIGHTCDEPRQPKTNLSQLLHQTGCVISLSN